MYAFRWRNWKKWIKNSNGMCQRSIDPTMNTSAWHENARKNSSKWPTNLNTMCKMRPHYTTRSRLRSLLQRRKGGSHPHTLFHLVHETRCWDRCSTRRERLTHRRIETHARQCHSLPGRTETLEKRLRSSAEFHSRWHTRVMVNISTITFDCCPSISYHCRMRTFLSLPSHLITCFIRLVSYRCVNSCIFPSRRFSSSKVNFVAVRISCSRIH